MGILLGIVIAAAALAVLYCFATATGADASVGWMKQYKYAHRGLHDALMPENSMKAFERAARSGYAIELDVHLSRDGHVVVFHDFALARMTGKQGQVEDYTLAQLRQIRLSGTQETIPTLADVLAMVDGRVPLLIELKNEGGAGELEVKTNALLKGYKGKYAVQSFSPFSMAWFRKHEPDTLRGQLSCTFSQDAEEWPGWQKFMLRHLMTNFLCRPHFVSYGIDGAKMPVLQRIRRRGVPLLIWTVRSEQEQKKLEQIADGIIFEDFCA